MSFWSKPDRNLNQPLFFLMKLPWSNLYGICIVAADGLVLQHQGISSYYTDYYFATQYFPAVWELTNFLYSLIKWGFFFNIIQSLYNNHILSYSAGLTTTKYVKHEYHYMIQRISFPLLRNQNWSSDHQTESFFFLTINPFFFKK